MPLYKINPAKIYAVQKITENNHIELWREIVALINSRKTKSAPDFMIEALCNKHKNTRYFNYITKAPNQWLVNEE